MTCLRDFFLGSILMSPTLFSRFQKGIEVTKQGTTAAYFRAHRRLNRATIAIRKESGGHFPYIQEFASPPQFTTSASGQSNTDSHTRTSDTKTKASCGGHKKVCLAHCMVFWKGAHAMLRLILANCDCKKSVPDKFSGHNCCVCLDLNLGQTGYSTTSQGLNF
ncbi:hypothetical protein OSB04_001780 [Centaurea solstitialis]|uniref:Uncharacterized protein n=1 Tax=Centaurea solstitialis TaxID=347529 RepID=A0AA38TS02_9ASTR|nr:hypothetical protein OSB04_001780 [Centaurea solstitialis]